MASRATPEDLHKPLAGGYYWLPAPTQGGVAWAVLTCHDLSQGPEVGHVDLWPAVVDRLAATWGRDARALRRVLSDRYTGLPRGRVTRPGRAYFVLHGDDAPVPDWEERLLAAFGLGGRPYRFLFDEHERMLPGDPERVEVALGVRLLGGRSR
jgi:hypothetical protein